MRIRSLLALAVLAWASPSAAATLYVSPSGSGTSCTPGSPCDLGTANSQAQPGDVVSLASGTYSEAPLPARSGTYSSRIEYRGNPANKNAVVVPAMRVNTREFVTWRFLRFDGDLEIFKSGISHSLHNLKFANATVIGNMALGMLSYCSFDSCALYPPQVSGGLGQNYFSISNNDCPIGGYGADSTFGNSFLACSLFVRHNSSSQQCSTADPLFKFSGASTLANNPSQLWVDNLSFRRNRVLIVFAPGATINARGVYFAGATKCRFQDNTWSFKDSSGCETDHVSLRIRDYGRFLSFTRDTFDFWNVCGPMYVSSQGNRPRADQGDNKWESCVFRLDNSGVVDFSWGMNSDTVSRCVFISNTNSSGATCMNLPSLSNGNNVIDHNTFFTTDLAGAPLNFASASGSFGNWGTAATIRITNNIFSIPSTSNATSTAAAFYQLWSGRTFTIDNNLYAYFSSGGARAIRYQSACTGASSSGCTPSPAGYSKPGAGQPFANATGQDDHSVYGSPMFLDSTFARFDPRLRTGSAAIGKATDGSDVGAVSFAASAPDVTPPSAIADLSSSTISNDQLTLGWTAPGDDGSAGAASLYDLRVSTSPIDAGNFGSAGSVPGVPAPASSGVSQKLLVTDLQQGTTYFFAIRARDEAGNWSGLGFHTVTTDVVDRIDPAAVQDLNATP